MWAKTLAARTLEIRNQPPRFSRAVPAPSAGAASLTVGSSTSADVISIHELIHELQPAPPTMQVPQCVPSTIAEDAGHGGVGVEHWIAALTESAATGSRPHITGRADGNDPRPRPRAWPDSVRVRAP